MATILKQSFQALIDNSKHVLELNNCFPLLVDKLIDLLEILMNSFLYSRLDFCRIYVLSAQEHALDKINDSFRHFFYM